MGVTQQQIDQAFIRFKDKFGGLKQDYFGLLFLSQEAGKKPEDIAHKVSFGPNDYGVDGFYVDRECRGLFLYQFKWTTDHHQFKSSFKRLIDAGMEQIFGNPFQDKSQNQLILQLKKELNENEPLIDRIMFYFVFNGDPEHAEKSEVLSSLREDLESKKYLIDQSFENRKVSLTIQYISNHTKKLGSATHTKKTHRYLLKLPAQLNTVGPNQENVCITLLPLMDLHGMYKEMGQRFFERNVRASLDPDRAANRSIRNAFKTILEGTTPPETFVFNHNGVTLAAQTLEFDLEGNAIITEPRLLNGAQTVSSLDHFLDKNDGNQRLKECKKRLDQIQVIAKIIWNATENFIVNTTVCNNRQNPVEPWNLRASDPVQLEIQDRFREGLRIYYERQEKAFNNLRDEELEELDVAPGRAIEIKFLAQTILAMQGELDKMSTLKEVFESEKVYRETFQLSYFSHDLRPIVLAYKVRFRLGRIIDEIQSKGLNKYHYVSRARNLVWALMIQGVLNSKSLGDECEFFGNQLVVESDFSNFINEIASTRLRPILSSVIESGDYMEQLTSEKYGFLKSKVVYSKCMVAARNRFKWEKKSFGRSLR